MAGHNRWSQIKHKKAKEDVKKGKTFTKIIKEITLAAREGGGDPASNATLRTLLEKAKEANMPQDNANRAIKRGIGELPGQNYEAYTYEGYGPSGIAIMVDVLSDNKNRSVADLRHLFSANGGSLADSGAVSWMFEHLGVIRASGSNLTEDALLEQLIEFPIHDVKKEDTGFVILCDAKALDAVRKTVSGLTGIKIENAELEWVAKNNISLQDADEEKAMEFLSEIQDHEDVKNVYTNLA